MSIKFYTSPKNFIPPKNEFLATPLDLSVKWALYIAQLTKKKEASEQSQNCCLF